MDDTMILDRPTTYDPSAKLPTLSELSDEINQLEDILDTIYGDPNATEDEKARAVQAIDDLLTDTKGNITLKLENYCRLINEKKASASVRKAEADRLATLARTDSNMADRLKDRLYWFMGTIGMKKIETPSFKIGLENNGGKLAMTVDREATIPKKYMKLVVDDEAIRADLDAGKKLKFAWLQERGTHIRIR